MARISSELYGLPATDTRSLSAAGHGPGIERDIMYARICSSTRRAALRRVSSRSANRLPERKNSCVARAACSGT